MKGKKVRFTEGSFTAFCREAEVFVWMGIDLLVFTRKFQ